MKPLKPTTKKEPIDMSEFVKSSDDTIMDGDILVHSGPKQGKTFLAASASEQYPTDPDLSKLKKTVVLEDMLWQAFDKGATAGFHDAHLRVLHVVDCVAILKAYKLPDAIQKIVDLSRDLIAKNTGIKWLVGDTISQLDKYIVGYYGELHANNPNDFAVYKDTFTRHKKHHANTTLLNLRNIWLCHSKAVIEASLKTGDQQNRAKASAIPGGDPITPDLTGQSRTVYIGNSSLELVIKTFIEPGKDKKKVRRVVYPFGTQGFEGSNRFHQKLDMEEPAHLGLLFKKIQG